MKTNDFIARMECIGLDTQIVMVGNKECIRVCTDSVGVIAFVSTKEIFKINCCDAFSDLTISEKGIVFNALVEYASTPIEEREEKKRYKYKLKRKVKNRVFWLVYSNHHQKLMLGYNNNNRPQFQTVFKEGDPLLNGFNLDMFDKIEVDE